MTTTEPTAGIPAVGVTHDGRSAHLPATTGEKVALMPEPTNPADPNAIAIHRWIDGELVHVGYLPADIAQRVEVGRFGCTGHIGRLRYRNGEVRGFDVRIPRRVIGPSR